MKKSLIALAALAAVGAASAQSSVTLYGILDTGYGWSSTKTSFNNGVDGPTTVKERKIGLNSGNLSGSRWGMKGQEDLGNGLSAVFNVEAGFSSHNGRNSTTLSAAELIDVLPVGAVTTERLQTGTIDPWGLSVEAPTNMFNRRSVVGLKGNFGQVVVGRDYTPLDSMVADGPFQAVDIVGSGFYTPRANGVHYSGNFSGIGVSAFAGYDDYKVTVDNAALGIGKLIQVRKEGYGAGVSYANGPFAIAGAVQHFKNRLESDSIAFINLGKTSHTEYGIGASYDFTAAKVLGYYLANDPNVGKTAQQFGLGVTAPVGPVRLGAQYAYNKRDDFKGHNFGLEAIYGLSKRTDVYAQAMRTNAWKNSGIGYESNTDKVSVGIRHSF